MQLICIKCLASDTAINCASIIVSMPNLWLMTMQMHFDDAYGAYFDFGNHTEKVHCLVVYVQY